MAGFRQVDLKRDQWTLQQTDSISHWKPYVLLGCLTWWLICPFMFHFYFLLLLVSKSVITSVMWICYLDMLTMSYQSLIFQVLSSLIFVIFLWKILYNANDLLRFLFDKKRPARNCMRGWLIIIQIVFVFSYFYQQDLFKFVTSLL